MIEEKFSLLRSFKLSIDASILKQLFFFQSTISAIKNESHESTQHLINNNTRYKYGLKKREIDLLHTPLLSFLLFLFPQFSPTQFISCSTFFSFRLSLFLSSSRPRLSLSFLACHGITSYRSPAACHLHQTAGASSSGRQPLRAHVSVSTLARVHTYTQHTRNAHIHMCTQTRRVSTSGRHTDGYGCHGGSAVLHSPSSPFSP